MNNSSCIPLLLATNLLAMGSSPASVYTWTSDGSNINWSNASNWDMDGNGSPSTPPNSDAGVGNRIVIADNSNVNIGNYSVNNDASELVVGNNVTLNPNWNFRFGSVNIGTNVVINTTGDGLTCLGNITTDSILYLKSNANEKGLRAMAVGSTLNLGMNGAIISMTMDNDINANLNGKHYILTGELDLYAATADASINAGDYYWNERFLFGGKEMWNREKETESANAIFNFEMSDFINGAKITSGRSDGMGTDGYGVLLSGLQRPDETEANLGAYYFKATSQGIYVVYLAQNGYAIPEPATWTLGLIGLAGLVTRRRR